MVTFEKFSATENVTQGNTATRPKGTYTLDTSLSAELLGGPV
jgi:hypothetical protein